MQRLLTRRLLRKKRSLSGLTGMSCFLSYVIFGRVEVIQPGGRNEILPGTNLLREANGAEILQAFLQRLYRISVSLNKRVSGNIPEVSGAIASRWSLLAGLVQSLQNF